MKCFAKYTTLFACIIPLCVHAQSDEYIPNEKPLDFKRYFAIGYTIGSPVADMSQHFEPWSYSGLFGEYRGYVKDNFSVGVELGWISFYGKGQRETYQWGNGAITAQAYRFYNTLGANITARYSLLYDKKYNVFAGIAPGIHYNTSELRLGYLKQTDNKWTLGIAPELGGFQSLSKSGIIGMQISVRFNYIFFKTQCFDATQFISCKTGLVVRL